MNVSTADNTTAATQSSKASTSQKNLDKTYNDFLLLLTTQLKNQDPLDPQDSSQFTSQLAQLSSVQEQVDMNANLERLIALVGGSEINNAVSYIGRVVEAAGNESLLVDNGTEKSALFVYDLPVEAQSTNITVTDQSGKVVYSGEAPTTKGRNELVWDGSSNISGQNLPTGTYKFNIIAKDYNGETIKAKTYTTGIVTSVDTQDGAVTLSLGGIRVNFKDISAIRTAQELL